MKTRNRKMLCYKISAGRFLFFLAAMCIFKKTIAAFKANTEYELT